MSGIGIAIGTVFKPQGALLNLIAALKSRVLADGGEISSDYDLNSYIRMAKSNGIYDSILFGMLGAYNLRTDGNTEYVTKAYDMSIEDAQPRRNLLTYTEEFDNAVWVKFSATISSNLVNSPTQALSADKIIESANVSQHELQSTLFSGIHTFSVYAKKAERDVLTLFFSVVDKAVSFDLTNGTTAPAIFGTLPSSYGIEDVGDGWFRCYISDNMTNSSVRIRVNNSSEYLGDGVSGFYVWGAQLEQGSTLTDYQRVIDSNSWDGVIHDATQTTEASQPYLTGFIAPNEKWGLNNPNGGSRYMTHPTISFAANEAWSVTISFNWNCSSLSNEEIISRAGGSTIRIRHNGSNQLRFINSSISSIGTAYDTSVLIGKNSTLCFVANGDGSLLVYVNGEYLLTIINPTNVDWAWLFRDRSNVSSLSGSYNSVFIRNQALTPAQVAAEATKLRQIFPEIPSVSIGSQTWQTSNHEVVSTPLGNPIANVTDNTAWSNSQATYDSVYAATSGTDEEKTYAAVKAAAMWSYYNNDSALGAIYGKLYNWFAVKLLQMDIDYYNAANPSTPWGWRVPTQTDFNTLATTLGGASVAGGKMKVAGTDYWSSPNTGADNSSGLSGLGGGYRLTTGSFTSILNRSVFYNIDKKYLVVYYEQDAINPSVDGSSSLALGLSFRLIKS